MSSLNNDTSSLNNDMSSLNNSSGFFGNDYDSLEDLMTVF